MGICLLVCGFVCMGFGFRVTFGLVVWCCGYCGFVAVWLLCLDPVVRVLLVLSLSLFGLVVVLW